MVDVPASVIMVVVVHTSPVEQAVVQLPQCCGSEVRSAHTVPHCVSPIGQPQVPWLQLLPLGQTLPQLPQLLGSFITLVQPPLQSITLAPPVQVVPATH